MAGCGSKASHDSDTLHPLWQHCWSLNICCFHCIDLHWSMDMLLILIGFCSAAHDTCALGWMNARVGCTLSNAVIFLQLAVNQNAHVIAWLQLTTPAELANRCGIISHIGFNSPIMGTSYVYKAVHVWLKCFQNLRKDMQYAATFDIPHECRLKIAQHLGKIHSLRKWHSPPMHSN